MDSAQPGCLKRNAPQAFTLIELLVVIAIVAVLASLLLPALQRAKAAGQTAACLSNAKQFGLGLNLFVGDYGRYPLLEAAGSDNPKNPYPENGFSWYDALEPYLGGKAAELACPARVRGLNVAKAYKSQYLHYGYNAWGFPATEQMGLGGHSPSTKISLSLIYTPVKENEVAAPSQMIAIGEGVVSDGIHFWSRVMVGRTRPSNADPGLDLKASDMLRHHGGRLNIAFGDAHVEGIKVRRLFSDTSDDALRLWNKDNQSRQ